MFTWSTSAQAQTLSTSVDASNSWLIYLLPLTLVALLILFVLKKTHWKHPKTLPPELATKPVIAKELKSDEPGISIPAEPADVSEILRDSESSWLGRLRDGLSKTRNQLSGSIGSLFGTKKVFNDELLEELHENLYRSDMGVETADRMVAALRKKFSGQSEMPTWDQVSQSMRDEITAIFGAETKPLNRPASGPMVILVVGVASVAFDGVKAAKARAVDVLLIDTAGRLHSKAELMDELAKIKRVIQKELPEAPHETWLVIDSTNGQNAVQQVKAFGDLVQLSGLIVTKLDGTAKGGVIVGIHNKFHIPIRYIGVGEKAADLKEFQPREYADSLFS
ncbi:MAG: signal recognition particle-docking protein FtsY [Proteobacteria bacterium]|nr:MAG: signal recognition particle-docking protein FtsY [Pseudomonadota bacterium]